MNKIKFFFLIIITFSLLVFGACSKKSDDKVKELVNQDPLSLLQNDYVESDAEITIIGQGRGEPTELFNDISTVALFKNEGNNVLVNSVKLADYDFPVSSDRYYDQLFPNMPNFNKVAQKFGRTVNLSVDGGANFPSFSKDVKMPDKMGITNLPLTISKSNGITLNFTPESSTEYKVDFLVIDYDVSVSRLLDPTMPNLNINTYQYDDETQGLDRFSFDSSDLSDFPIGSTVNIKLVRILREYIYVGEKRVEVSKMTTQNSIAKIVL